MRHLFAPWREKWVTGQSSNDAGEHRVGTEPDRGGKIASPPSGSCLFCAIASDPGNDRENLVVVRRRDTIIMLNRYPYNAGHLMVVPLEHTASLSDLSQESAAGLMHGGQQAVQQLSRALRADGFNIGINQGSAGGAGIPGHLHLHVVPRWSGDTNFLSTVGGTRVVSVDLIGLCDRLAREFEATEK